METRDKITWELASTFILGFQDGVERAAQRHQDYRKIQKYLENDTSLITKCLEALNEKPSLDPEVVAYSISYSEAKALMRKIDTEHNEVLSKAANQ